MHTLEAIQQRRAVKAYDPNHTLTEAEIQQLLSLAIQSPTAFNIQNWRFVLVKDPALRKQIRAVSWDQPQVTDASLLVILCADLKAWEKEPKRYWKHTSPEVQGMILPAIDNYYKNKNQVQRDEAMRSCGIAAQTLMLAAKAMGYDSCPMDGFDFEAVATLIHLPKDHVITMFVAIGKAIKPAHPKPGQLELKDVLVYNHF